MTSSQNDDLFAEFRATPDKVWTTLLSIHGELRDANAHLVRLESAVLSVKQSVQVGSVVIVVAALALLLLR